MPPIEWSNLSIRLVSKIHFEFQLLHPHKVVIIKGNAGRSAGSHLSTWYSRPPLKVISNMLYDKPLITSMIEIVMRYGIDVGLQSGVGIGSSQATSDFLF